MGHIFRLPIIRVPDLAQTLRSLQQQQQQQQEPSDFVD
jgi:hypothetical protein